MGRESPKKPELYTLVEAWLQETKQIWQIIPEFQVKPEQLKHLGVVCDGNRRAAENRGLPTFFGHKIGIEVVKGLSQACRKWGIKYLTFWLWSTENWTRDQEQIINIMRFGEKELLKGEIEEDLVQNRVKLTHFGRKDRLPPTLASILSSLESKTTGFNDYYLNLAIDYGGLDEIARAFASIHKEMVAGRLTTEELLNKPKTITRFLDSHDQPAVDLVIRTGVGQDDLSHTSGFMPLYTIYASWIFLPDLFPELKAESIILPIQRFLETTRRLGR